MYQVTQVVASGACPESTTTCSDPPPRVFALDMECYYGHLTAASYATVRTVSDHFVATTSGGIESVSNLYSDHRQVDEPRNGFCNARLSGSNQGAYSNHNFARHALYCIA